MSDKINDLEIIDEMNNSFLDYAMSVIVSRALPDVRDGLKPVHRRILFAMNDLGNYADKPYKKSARIVGDVIGKYHPHGDSSVYSAMVRMAQDFSTREMLVDGHGNFGSLDGDGAAAMRYTEARMSKLAMELIKDMNKKCVDFQENYDGTELEPVVLPSRYPNLLVNGSSGIAVGMATNIPPHNLGEVIAGTIALIQNPDITIDELNEYIKGPDFPLGAKILGLNGIKKMYHSGNGSMRIRSKYDVFEEKNGKHTIIISEIPYQVNKAVLVEKIADCVKNKIIEGITDIRDESNREGIRVVIELSRNTTPEIVINNLFKYTNLEMNYSANMLALVNGEPKVLNLKEILHYYYLHQVDVNTRKIQFDLKKAEDRAHILKGLAIALDNIDAVIALIRAAATQDIAMKGLIERFGLTEIQSKAILDMQFKRLTGLERQKIEAELNDLDELIKRLHDILADSNKLDQIIIEELNDIYTKYGNPRRTVIDETYAESNVEMESLMEEQDIIITLTENGYIKRNTEDAFRVQSRGGKGSKGMNVGEDDNVNMSIFTTTHSDLLFFTNTGRVFKIRSHQVPEFSRTARGLPLVNLIDIEKNESVTNIISFKEYNEGSNLFFATECGLGKKTSLTEYLRIKKNGKRAISLNEGDVLKSVFEVRDDELIFVASADGKAVLTESTNIRNMGRTSRGVRILRLSENDKIIGAVKTNVDNAILTITENGYGKATPISDYRIQNRGGKGVKNLKITDKTGNVVGIAEVESTNETGDLLMVSKNGIIIRTKLNEVKYAGRATQGVRMMRLSEDDKVVFMVKLPFMEDVSRETISEEVES